MDAADRGGALCLGCAGTRTDLARVLGQGSSVDLLVEDLAVQLEGRAVEVVKVANGWMLATRPAYAPTIRAAAALRDGGIARARPTSTCVRGDK